MTFSATDHATDPHAVLEAGALARLSELDPTGNGTLVQRVLTTYATSLERTRHELVLARSPILAGRLIWSRIGRLGLKNSIVERGPAF